MGYSPRDCKESDTTERLHVHVHVQRSSRSEKFTELHGEEKREEGVRGDLNEMSWDQKRRDQGSQ